MLLLAALTREESRGGHTRDDFPGHEEEYWGKHVNIVWMDNGEIKIRQDPIVEMREDLQEAIKEVKAIIAEKQRSKEVASNVTERKETTIQSIERAGEDSKLEEYELTLDEGMVVLDCVHRIQYEQEPDLAVRWNCKAGKCGSCSAEINGKPALMCMTRMSDVVAETPPGPTNRNKTDEDLSTHQGPSNRCFMELRSSSED